MIPIAMALAQFAPQIIGLLAGQKAGDIADKVVGIAQTVTGTATPEAAVAAVQADPEKALAFQRAIAEKEIELARIDAEVLKAQFGVTLAQLDADVKLNQADAGDRDSARRMQAELKSWGPPALAVVVTLGFFFVLTLMLVGVFKAEENQTLLILLGALSAGFGQVLNFYFGSSHGSQVKNQILARK